MRMIETHPLAIAAMGAFSGAVLLSAAPDLLKLPFALLLVLWLPGAAIMASAFPGEPPTAASRTLSVALSVACVVLVGLFLNVLDGLSQAGWALALGGFSLLAPLPGVWRQTARGRAPVPAIDPLPASEIVMFALAAVLALGAYLHARTGAIAHDEYRYTEFWLVPAPASSTAAMLGIRNAERVPTAYEIEVLDNDRASGRWQPMRLEPGETWTTSLAIVRGPQPRRIEAKLFRDGDRRRIYRQVWMEVPAAPVSAGKVDGSRR